MSFLAIRLIPFGKKFRIDDFDLPEKLIATLKIQFDRFCEKLSGGYRVNIVKVVDFVDQRLEKLLGIE